MSRGDRIVDALKGAWLTLADLSGKFPDDADYAIGRDLRLLRIKGKVIKRGSPRGGRGNRAEWTAA